MWYFLKKLMSEIRKLCPSNPVEDPLSHPPKKLSLSRSSGPAIVILSDSTSLLNRTLKSSSSRKTLQLQLTLAPSRLTTYKRKRNRSVESVDFSVYGRLVNGRWSRGRLVKGRLVGQAPLQRRINTRHCETLNCHLAKYLWIHQMFYKQEDGWSNLTFQC